MYNKIHIGQNAAEVLKAPAFKSISKVAVLVDDKNEYVSGDDAGRTLEVTCPYGSQAMADNLLAQLKGYVYQPMTAQDALLDPAAEIGDGVTVGGVYTILAQIDTMFDMHCAADIAAPGEEELETEYVYQTPEKRLERQLATTRSLITKTAEEIRLEIEAVDGRMSSITQTIDNLSFSVKGVDGKVSEIKLSGDGTIDLSGLVTFSALSDSPGSGQTKINGGWIDTETLTVSNIEIKDGSITWAKLSSGAKNNIASPTYVSSYIGGLVQEGTLVTDETVTTITQDAISTATITANQITSGTITAGNLAMKGVLRLDYGLLPYGYVGASNAGNYTGAVLCDDTQTNYFIATRGGARMTAGDSASIYVIDDGCYSTSAMKVASDRRLKKNINYDLSQEERFFSLLRPCSFEMIKDKTGKRRWGIIAQDAIAAAESVGMDPFKLGLIGQDSGMYSVGYSEMTPINTYMIQLLMSRMDRLEAAYGI